MSEMPLAAWQPFYVIIGTAAAALTGLMFVVATLLVQIRGRMSTPEGAFAAYNTPNVVHFGAALLISALCSAPWQALWHASILLGLLGLGGMIYAIIVLRRVIRQADYRPVLEDWLWHTIFPLASYTILLVTAIILPYAPTPALFVMAAGSILLLFVGIHNAWDNLTYIAFQFSHPQDKSPDERTQA